MLACLAAEAAAAVAVARATAVVAVVVIMTVAAVVVATVAAMVARVRAVVMTRPPLLLPKRLLPPRLRPLRLPPRLRLPPSNFGSELNSAVQPPVPALLVLTGGIQKPHDRFSIREAVFLRACQKE